MARSPVTHSRGYAGLSAGGRCDLPRRQATSCMSRLWRAFIRDSQGPLSHMGPSHWLQAHRRAELHPSGLWSLVKDEMMPAATAAAKKTPSLRNRSIIINKELRICSSDIFERLETSARPDGMCGLGGTQVYLEFNPCGHRTRDVCLFPERMPARCVPILHGVWFLLRYLLAA